MVITNNFHITETMMFAESHICTAVYL